MIKVMLQAVSEMLCHKESDNVLNFETQVSCAKTILDKIIEGLGDNPVTQVYAPMQIAPINFDIEKEPKPTPLRDPVKPEPELKPKPEPKPLKGPVDGKYKIVKDANNRLVRIEGLAKDAKMELDGKIMTYEEAIGKEFIGGRIL